MAAHRRVEHRLPVPGAEVLLRSDGEYLALFNDVWALRRIEKNHPDLTLLPIGTHNPAK